MHGCILLNRRLRCVTIFILKKLLHLLTSAKPTEPVMAASPMNVICTRKDIIITLLNNCCSIQVASLF